jgi:hypothetical protein
MDLNVLMMKEASKFQKVVYLIPLHDMEKDKNYMLENSSLVVLRFGAENLSLYKKKYKRG